MNQMKSPSNIDVSFFETLYQFCDEGNVNIRPIPGGNSFVSLGNFQDIANICNGNKNYYFGVALRKDKGTKEDITEIPAVHCDCDFKDTPQNVLRQNLKRFPFKPSIIVKSGGGIHFYWILKEAGTIFDVPVVEDINKRIAVMLGGDLNACDASRIMRIPGTLNQKYDPPVACQMLQKDSFYYNLETFLETLPELEIKKPAETKNNEWLNQAMQGVSDGERNATATKIAGYWINKLSASDTLEILNTWNQNNNPPLSLSDIQIIVKSVSRYKQGSNVKTDLSNVYNSARMIEAYEQYIVSLKNNRFITGINEIDKRIRGVAGGEVLTLMARAGCFKTAALQNILKNYIDHSSWAAVFFSLEMPVASVTERYFSILDSCTGRDVEKMFVEPEMQTAKAAAIQEFKKDLKNLYIIPSRISINDIGKYVQLIENEYNIKVGVIGIDYLGLIDSHGTSEYEIVSKVARSVKTVAKQLNLPVVLLSQINRKGEDGQVEVSLSMGRGCFDEETEILSKNGWVKFSNLQKGMPVLTMNPDTQKAFYTVPVEYFEYDYNNELYFYKNLKTEFMVTPEHKFLYRKENSKQIRMCAIKSIKGIKVHIGRAFNWIKPDIKQFSLPGIIKKTAGGRGQIKTPKMAIDMNAWLEFLGWYLSEGHCGKKDYSISITQKKQKNIPIIRNVLNKIGFNFCESKNRPETIKFKISAKQLHTYLSKLGRLQPERKIPRFICELSARQIRIFLDSFLLGDGSSHKGMKNYYTSSKQMADVLQELILKTGNYASIAKIDTKGTQTWIVDHVAIRTVDMYVVCEWQKPAEATIDLRKIIKQQYNGKVYCVGVGGSQLIYVRRNGKCLWSGNSGAIEEGADFVLGLWQETEEDQTKLICKILKNRKGYVGSKWELDLHAECLAIGSGAIEHKTEKKKNGFSG